MNLFYSYTFIMKMDTEKLKSIELNREFFLDSCMLRGNYVDAVNPRWCSSGKANQAMFCRVHDNLPKDPLHCMSSDTICENFKDSIKLVPISSTLPRTESSLSDTNVDSWNKVFLVCKASPIVRCGYRCYKIKRAIKILCNIRSKQSR